ncbi:MAG: prolyl oligopeptidase family serine peptidase [Acidobacteriia bacterium]|nr:prolyl oligopeptidase family serine peptidase [Terriglobia bacterium]MBZ5658340.1 prolyl oligopeptidase family serine peptidase [Terriglobia bacterium]
MKFITRILTFLFVLAVTVSFAQSVIAPLAPARPDPSLPSTSTQEDISTISLDKSDLHADPPVLVEKDEEADFVRELFHVEWRPHDSIYLYVVRPRNGPKTPVVIYLYGHPSETDRYQDDGWCKRRTAGGIAAVGFVPALTGQRYHDRPMKEWFVSELQESLGKSAHDVQMVLNYLGQRGDVDMSNVGMFGVGAGGTIAAMAASVDSRIKAVYLLDPWGDWPAWTAQSEIIPEEERPRYITPDFLKKVAAFDPVALLPRLKTQRIRLDQVSDDVGNTPEDAQKHIEAALPSGAEHHHFDGPEFFSVSSGGRVFDWIKFQVKIPDSKEHQSASTQPPLPDAHGQQEGAEKRQR